MREKVLAVKELWTQPEAEFHGRFAGFAPVAQIRPFQSPHPPVLVGSHGAAVPWNTAMSGSRGSRT